MADVLLLDTIAPLPEGTIMIGGANNLLISSTPPPLAMLSKRFSTIMIEEDHLHIGAAMMSGRIHSFCKKHDIAGFEYLSKLPGTLGGLLKMNAGMKEDEIFNSLVKIRTEDGWIAKDEIAHGYRYADISGIVYEAVFQITKGYSVEKLETFSKMRYNQPKEPSAGSVFKNPKDDFAGRLIEAVGLKGVREGGAMFSPVHANFLVNVDHASFDDAIFLIELAQKRVYEKFGIMLENEVQIIKS